LKNTKAGGTFGSACFCGRIFFMSNSELIRDSNYVTDTGVYFYTPRFYAFDNMSAFSVTIWGYTFMTAEHAYQWKKYSSSHPKLALEILHAPSAYATKKIANAHIDITPADWVEQRVEAMESILRAKMKQHEKLVRLLIETEDRVIYENSPTDNFWGIGSDGMGENTLGKLWMKLRDELK